MVGGSASNAQIGGVIGQNAVENNVDSPADYKEADERSKRMYNDTCTSLGMSGAACGAYIQKEGYEILKGTAAIFVPTTIYELVPIGKGVGLAIKGTKKLVAVYKDSKTAKNAAEKAGAKVENNVYRDDVYGYDWTSSKKLPNNSNLTQHWNKHKSEFPELKSQNDYYRFAMNFVNNPPKGTLMKTRPNGDKVFYEVRTNTFAVMSKDGLPRTVFKPNPDDHRYSSNLEYFNAQ